MTKHERGALSANAPKSGEADLETRLSRLRAALDGRAPRLDAPFPAVTLIFSVSDGAARAVTAQGSGATVDAAWEVAVTDLHRKMGRRKLRGRFLRLDWVEKAETWTGRCCANACGRSSGTTAVAESLWRRALPIFFWSRS